MQDAMVQMCLREEEDERFMEGLAGFITEGTALIKWDCAGITTECPSWAPTVLPMQNHHSCCRHHAQTSP